MIFPLTLSALLALTQALPVSNTVSSEKPLYTGSLTPSDDGDSLSWSFYSSTIDFKWDDAVFTFDTGDYDYNITSVTGFVDKWEIGSYDANSLTFTISDAENLPASDSIRLDIETTIQPYYVHEVQLFSYLDIDNKGEVEIVGTFEELA